MIGLRRCLLLGLLSYLIFMVITIPASIVVTSVNNMLQNSPIVLNNAQGTIWHGSTDLLINHDGLTEVGNIRAGWSFQPLALLMGRIGVNISLDGPELQLKGSASDGVGPFELKIRSAEFGPNWINTLLSRQRVKVVNPVQANAILWRFELSDKATRAAQGTMNWRGGEVSIGQAGGRVLQVEPIEGELSIGSEGETVLTVVAQRSRKELVKAQLLTSGELKLKVLKRVQEVAGMGQIARPDDTLINLRQKVF